MIFPVHYIYHFGWFRMIFLKNPGFEKIAKNLASSLASPSSATRPVAAADIDDRWKWETYEDLRKLKRVPNLSRLEKKHSSTSSRTSSSRPLGGGEPSSSSRHPRDPVPKQDSQHEFAASGSRPGHHSRFQDGWKVDQEATQRSGQTRPAGQTGWFPTDLNQTTTDMQLQTTTDIIQQTTTDRQQQTTSDRQLQTSRNQDVWSFENIHTSGGKIIGFHHFISIF